MFEGRQREAARRTDARLAEILDASAATGTPERLAAAMRHAVLGGGKRFRPFLVLECAALFEGSQEAAVEVAASLECLHCYSLVHDDLPAMDNDRLRRGRPTVWAAFDDWTAILAGDALLTLSFEILAGAHGLISADAVVQLTRRLARAAGRHGMVGGQAMDIAAEKLDPPASLDAEHIRRLQAMKTGALIVFACEAGAIISGAGPDQTAALVRYGEALGLCFQISDDLLDAVGEASVAGKAVGKDEARGKATFVSLAGVQQARQELSAAVGRALDALCEFGNQADGLRGAAQAMLDREK